MTAEQPKISICVPTTIISPVVCRSQQQATHILSQLSRIALMYNVSEIIILEAPDLETIQRQQEKKSNETQKITFDDEPTEPSSTSDDEKSAARLIATMLQFFITPPYLRSAVFDRDALKACEYAKKLPKSMHLPFLSATETSRYREGISVSSSEVNVGLATTVSLKGQKVPKGVRVTVDTANNKVVSPLEAYGKGQTYGYFVRIARNLETVFTESPVKNGYETNIWVPSEGWSVSDADTQSLVQSMKSWSPKLNTADKYISLTFGDWRMLQLSMRQGDNGMNIEKPSDVFDGVIPMIPKARVEDAVTIALTKCLD